MAPAASASAIDAKHALQRALGRLTVSELVGCKETLRTFHGFLATGTLLERQRLCPPLRRRRRAHLSTAPSPSPSPSPTPSPSPSPASPPTPPSPATSYTSNSTPTPIGTPTLLPTPFRTPSPPQSSPYPSPPLPPPSRARSPARHLSSEESSPSPSSSFQTDGSSTVWTRGEAGGSPTPSLPSLSPTSPSDSWSSHDHDVHAEASITTQAQIFFRSRLGWARQHRAHYLVRAVQGFMGASSMSPNFAEEIWLSRPDIFAPAEGTGLVARLRRLYDGHCRLKKSRDDYSCADRLCYVFLDHDLQQLVQSDELVMTQGRGRTTAALYKQARDISTTVDELRANRKAGSGYRHLLHHGGPGFLLQMGCQVSTIWERKLSKADIHLIVEFLKEKVPEVYEKGKALDAIAAQALVNGFLAYGWTLPELATTQSSLIDQLKLHVSMNEEPVDGKSHAEEVAQSQLNGVLKPSSGFASEHEAPLQFRNLEVPTNHGSLRNSAFSPSILPPLGSPASLLPPTPPSTDIFDGQRYNCHDFSLESQNHSLSELWFKSDEERLARHSFDAFSTCPSATDMPVAGDGEFIILPITPTYCRQVETFSPNTLTSNTQSNNDLCLLFGMDLDDAISSNADPLFIGTGSSPDAESSPVSTTILAEDTVMATMTSIHEDNWTGDLCDIEIEGGECSLLGSDADNFWALDAYMSPAGFGWNPSANGT